MKIPGWWRVRHLYNDIKLLLINRKKRESSKIFYFFQKLADKIVVLRAQSKRVKPGINVIGYAKGDFGLAEHLRLFAQAINKVGIKFCVNNTGEPNRHSQNNKQVENFITKKNPYLLNVFCFNGDQTITYLESSKGIVARLKHYNIGYGYWELSKYPSEWTKQNEYLNEYWAPTMFIKKVLEKSTTLPVYHMPIPVDFEIPVGFTRKQFNLPENKFLFLFTFDMSSFTSRKNPQAAIRAFVKAFPVEKSDNVCLIIKINRIKGDPIHDQKVSELRTQVKFDSRILLIDEILSRASILGLINVCDAYVSLHRSEGFGLGMAEAMNMGKVVIATNYSGNVDFMNNENSCPVNYRLVEVVEEEYCYVEKGAEWAEPDEDHAAYYMRKVYDNPEFTQKIGYEAKKYIEKHHNFKVIGENHKKRLLEILKEIKK
ncbi:MAG TPA: glycosyltransferase [Cytophagaceae bacterium]|jgi:glycosyltransferase involved in cell wall biosynthesis|nr:glycosyltransferase [Cytophagaceae bacterium]